MTSELYDSYFRLMTIKHAIPKIEWAIELSYNSVWTGQEVRRVGHQTSWRQDVVGKATTQQKGPSGPLMEFGDPLVTRCGRESRTQQSWSLGLRLISPGERERHNADGHKRGGQYIAVFVQSPTPSHTQNVQ